MSRLIDADVLHKAYMKLRNCKQDPQSGDWISLRAVPLTTVIRMLNEAPTIEAVSVEDYRSMENTCYKLQKALYEKADAPSIDIVRCGECKYFIDNLTEDDTDEAYDSCRWDWSRKIPTADDFCSYGEREGE